MASLLLVDVDNLLSYAHRATGSRAVQGCLERFTTITPQRLDDPACVVVCALNTASVFARDFSLQDLSSLAAKLAARCVVNPRVVAVEILLTLTMPEAADDALGRALQWAASANATVRTEHVFLLSNDRGLRRLLGPQSSSLNSHLYWARLKTPGQRQLPTARIPQNTLPEHPGWLLLDQPELAAAASLSPVQPPLADRTLRAVADLVERQPGWLTQLGPTLRSHRGADRLQRLLQNQTTLLSCHEDERVEHHGSTAPRTHLPAGQLGPSSLGPGALVLSTPEARHILRTRLPEPFVQQTRSLCEVRVRDQGLPDESLLHAGRDSMPSPLEPVTLDLFPTPNSIVAALRAPSPPTNWWVFWREKHLATTIKYNELAATSVSLARPLRGLLGQFFVTSIDGRPELVCRSPLRAVERVKLLASAAPRAIVQASNLDADPEEPCAFLALGRGWKHGDEVECVAIQHVEPHVLRDLSGLGESQVRALLRLPLIVALQSLKGAPLRAERSR